MSSAKRPLLDTEEVDDLEVAASYAAGAIAAVDDDAIELDGDDEEQRVPTKEDDDDESDVDLTEELAQMENGDEDEPVKDERPKTANEIDPYTEPLDRLGSVYQWRKEDTTSGQLQRAGTIRHAMLEEQTVVVASEAPLLDEGNLLFLRPNQPLGRILEVFGPVSQPLYSVRVTEDFPNDTMAVNLLSQPVWVAPQATRLPEIHRDRGCDASNWHDEEVDNPSEVYYSDDEEERQAKRGKGKSRSSTGEGGGASVPTGFHVGAVLAAPTVATVPASEAPEEEDTVYYD